MYGLFSFIQFPMVFLINHLKTGVIFLLFCLAIQVASAQDLKSFFGVRSGISFPVGDYSATDLERGSFAQPGFNVNAEGAWYFSKYLGAGFTAGLNLHPVDVASLGRAQVNREPFLTDVVIRSEAYRVINLMPAIYGACRITGNFTVNGKIGAGLLYAQTPYQLYKPDYYLLPDKWEEVTSASDQKFSWQAGIGITWKISSCLGLTLQSDVMYDMLEFTFNTASGPRTDKRQIAMINLLAGFNINF